MAPILRMPGALYIRLNVPFALPSMLVIELSSGRFEQHDDGIFVFRPSDLVELTAGDIRQYLRLALELSGGPAYALVDRRPGYALDFEAQELRRTELGRYLAAVAYLAALGPELAIVELTARLIDPSVEVEVFLDEEEALAWLRGLRS